MRNCTGLKGFPIVAAFAVGTLASGAGQTGDLPDFSTLSLDQLANVKITSFTGKQQKLAQVAGAVYVITQEQIARSGLTSVPELLRMAPGVDVARINGNQWSISARGPVGAYADKLLVLIDGRSIYSEVFSGVYWDLGMPILEDIDRIEVIRGPGATIWGANAVLGVINIITKSSRDTHGAMVTTGLGTSDRAFGSVRAGGMIGSTSFRGYFSGSDIAPLKQASGANANDGWQSQQAGFRLDGSHKKDNWMLKGDLFRAAENTTGVNVSLLNQSMVESSSRFNSYTGNLTGEWSRRISETGELRLQSYYDYADRPEPQNSKIETRIWDTQLKYDFKAGHVHNISVGAGERLINDNIGNSGQVTFSPSKLTYSNQNAFAQDEMHFAHDKLLFTIGAKLEHNHFSSWGLEPSTNLLWMATSKQSLWISAARSLRTPALFEEGVSLPASLYPGSPATGGLPVLVGVIGAPGFSAETVKDYEAGYRAQFSKRFSADLTGFYDQYSDIRSFVGNNPVLNFSPIPHLDLIERFTNHAGAVGKGAEASLAWQTLPEWKVEGSYTYNTVNPYLSAPAPPGTTSASENFPSHNKWRLQSYVNLSKTWQFDTFVYWTSPASPTSLYGPNILIPSYTRLDLRLGYKPSRHWQFSLAGQNLLQARHLEALTELLTAYSYVDRSVSLKCTWQR